MIAGLGSIGRRHLRNLVALGERDIVLFRTGLSTMPDEELEGFPTERNLEAALSRSPDAVIVANPTALHLDVAIPAAQAGCHVLLEKPVSGTLDRTEELRLAALSGKGRILVGYQYRFHPGLKAVKAWLEADAVGRVLTAAAEYRDHVPAWHPWEDFRKVYFSKKETGACREMFAFELGWLTCALNLSEVKNVSGITKKLSDSTTNAKNGEVVVLLGYSLEEDINQALLCNPKNYNALQKKLLFRDIQLVIRPMEMRPSAGPIYAMAQSQMITLNKLNPEITREDLENIWKEYIELKSYREKNNPYHGHGNS